MGSGRMAPAVKVPRAERTTRASTQTQTLKSYHNVHLSTKSLKAKNPGRVDKKRTNTANKAKNAAKDESKPDTNLDSTASSEDRDPSPNVSPTTLSINSPLVPKPITCHQYTPENLKNTPSAQSPFIFTHGAGGTLSAPAVVHFCTGFSSTSTTPLFAFQGSSNLGTRVKGFHACREHLHSDATELVFGGRSMGARAAVVAATEALAKADTGKSVKARLVLVSYPLKGPKDVRDRILLDLPQGTEVLFVVGDRDAMCPLELLDSVRAKMRVKSRLVVVRGADHGMNVRPASRTRELGEETGRVTARWLSGNTESKGETLYVGEEE